jgi:hypothetical protein
LVAGGHQALRSEAIVVIVVVQVEVNQQEQNSFCPLQAFLANQHRLKQSSSIGICKDDGVARLKAEAPSSHIILSIGGANLPATSAVYDQPYALLTSSKNDSINSVGRYIGCMSEMCRLAAAAAADVIVGVIVVVIGIVVIVNVVETPPADGQWPINDLPLAPVGCIGMCSTTTMATSLLSSLSSLLSRWQLPARWRQRGPRHLGQFQMGEAIGPKCVNAQSHEPIREVLGQLATLDRLLPPPPLPPPPPA